MNQPDSSSASSLTRRTLLQRAGLALASTAGLQVFGAASAAGAPAAKAAKAPKSNAAPAGERVPLNRFPRLMHDYFLARVATQERATEAKRAQLKTRAAAEQFIRERARIVTGAAA